MRIIGIFFVLVFISASSCQKTASQGNQAVPSSAEKIVSNNEPVDSIASAAVGGGPVHHEEPAGEENTDEENTQVVRQIQAHFQSTALVDPAVVTLSSNEKREKFIGMLREALSSKTIVELNDKDAVESNEGEHAVFIVDGPVAEKLRSELADGNYIVVLVDSEGQGENISVSFDARTSPQDTPKGSGKKRRRSPMQKASPANIDDLSFSDIVSEEGMPGSDGAKHSETGEGEEKNDVADLDDLDNFDVDGEDDELPVDDSLNASRTSDDI